MKRKNIYSVWITCYCCSSYSYIIFYLSCEHFKSNSSVFRSEPRCENQPYLPRSLHVDGDDVEAVAAQLAGPAASLADPLQQAVLVGVTHRAVAPTRVQQVALRTGEGRRSGMSIGIHCRRQNNSYYRNTTIRWYRRIYSPVVR